MPVVPILLAAVGLCVVLAPGLLTVLCGGVVIVQLAGLALRVRSTGRAVTFPAARAGELASPVFSIHVATHNEPPAMVIATLRALATQDWPASDYEIVVIDNNTVDPAVWLPVSDACADMGAHVRFMHRDGVVGAKAGALNIALVEARPDAGECIGVVGVDPVPLGPGQQVRHDQPPVERHVGQRLEGEPGAVVLVGQGRGVLWRRIGAHALQHIRPVHTRRFNSDQYLIGRWLRYFALTNTERFWPTRLGDFHGSHHFFISHRNILFMKLPLGTGMWQV